MRLRSVRPLVAAGLVGLLAVTVTGPAVAQDGDAPTITSQVITSFDGTDIQSTLFVPAGASADAPVPLIMRTHGWGGAGETEVSGTLARLLDEGYAVMTWDQRGFGQSGGDAEVDKPEFEGRDAAVLIDWAVANVPELAFEAPGDPVLGFTGGSYAGGIQTATSSFDPRVDAIVPEISWSDLRYSLFENGVVNFGWSQLLFGAGLATAATAGLNPGNAAGIETGSYSQELFVTEAQGLVFGENDDPELLAYFAASSLDSYGDDNPVTIPTMVMNGSVDTLFDLSDGHRIAEHVRAQGAPVKYVAFCGGHVSCPASYAEADDRAHLDDLIITWFAKHLLGEDVDTGAPVEYRTNEGVWRTADTFDGTERVTANVEGSLVQLGVPDPAGLGAGLPGTEAVPSQDGDPQAVTVEVMEATGGAVDLLGLPQLQLSVSGVGDTAHVFAKLVHREAGEVVNLQETPVRVEGLGDAVEFDLEMSGIAYTLPEGEHLDLQLSTSSLMHINARGAATVDVAATVSVPTRRAVTTAAPTTPATPSPAPDATATPSPAPTTSATPAAAPTTTGTLPSTGGGAAILALLAAASTLTRRRRT